MIEGQRLAQKYRGICFHKRKPGYVIRWASHGENRQWPHYEKDPVVAARIYDAVALELHGPDAILNFDGDPPPSRRIEVMAYIVRLRNQGFIT